MRSDSEQFDEGRNQANCADHHRAESKCEFVFQLLHPVAQPFLKFLKVAFGGEPFFEQSICGSSWLVAGEGEGVGAFADGEGGKGRLEGSKDAGMNHEPCQRGTPNRSFRPDML